MSIYRSRPPRGKNEGVALAAIVAKESSHGEWSGSGGGVGIGSGGIGVFSGSISGESSNQTHRAQHFAAPERASEENFFANSPFIVVAFIVGALLTFSYAAKAYQEGASGRLAFGVVLCAFLTVGLIIFLTGLGPNTRDENARNASAAQYDARRQQVYLRLRYVESDHVVFDPETGFETAAQRSHILALIDTILAHPTVAEGDSAAA